MRSDRCVRVVLAVVLGAWLAPLASAVGLALHLAHGHGHEHAPARAALALAHGHQHDARVPAHDHDATTPDAGPSTTLGVLFVGSNVAPVAAGALGGSLSAALPRIRPHPSPSLVSPLRL